MGRKKSNTALRKLVEDYLGSKDDSELIYNEGTEYELKLKVYKAIPFEKRTEMIVTIVSMVFSENPITIDDYRPMSYEFAKRYATLTYFTDLKLPTNINELWLVLNHTNIFDDVLSIVGGQLNSILEEAFEAIQAKVAYLTHKTDLNLLIEKFAKMLESTGESLAGVDIQQLAKALTSIRGVSTNDIVDGILRSAEKKEDIVN